MTDKKTELKIARMLADPQRAKTRFEALLEKSTRLKRKIEDLPDDQRRSAWLKNLEDVNHEMAIIGSAIQARAVVEKALPVNKSGDVAVEVPTGKIQFEGQS